MGFSSRETTGCFGMVRLLINCQDVFHVGDIAVIQFRNAPHFSPLRLEVLVQEHHANGLSPHARNQTSFDRLLGDQAHRPAAPASGRFTADPGDDPLLLAIVEQRGRAGARFIVKGPLQSALLEAVA